MSNSLWPHGLQHARIPCPSPTPGAYSNSCLSTRWCHPNISSSAVPISSILQYFPASASFQMSQLFAWGGQSIGVSASASILSMNNQDWFPIWTIKKAEHQRTDAFEWWCWRRLLKVPWTARRPNQSILKDFPGKNSGVGCHFLLQEIFPSLGLNLGLLHSRQTLYHLNHQGSSKGNQSWLFIGRIDAEAETPILWPPDAKNRHIRKTMMLGKTEGRRRSGWQRMR